MKKGDIKKQEILTVAEDLFCRKGYEETSVQDILDVKARSRGWKLCASAVRNRLPGNVPRKAKPFPIRAGS